MVGKALIGGRLLEPRREFFVDLLQVRRGWHGGLGKQQGRVRERFQGAVERRFALPLISQRFQVFQLLIEDKPGLLLKHVAVWFVAPPGQAVELKLRLHPRAPGFAKSVQGAKRLNNACHAAQQHLSVAYQQQIRRQQAHLLAGFRQCGFDEIRVGGRRGAGQAFHA